MFQKDNKKMNGAESPYCMTSNAKAKEVALREEKAFISLLFRDKALVSDVLSAGIQYKYFWWNDTSELFKIIAKYFDQYKAILTREQFRNEITKLYQEEEQTYYRSLYDEIINLDISSEDFPALKNGIKGRNLSRQAIEIINKHHQAILEVRGSNNKDVEKFIQDVLAIKGTGNDEYAQTIVFSESLKEVWEQIEDRQKHPENYYGLMSGFKCLDKRFNGFLAGKYLVFTGMPNGGKTTVMFNVAMNMATINKHGVVYVTIESEHMRATQRILCIYAGVDENRILRGGSGNEGLSEDIMKTLRQAKEELSNMDNFSWIQVVSGTPATKILEMVERKRSFGPIDVLFIDYLDIV